MALTQETSERLESGLASARSRLDAMAPDISSRLLLAATNGSGASAHVGLEDQAREALFPVGSITKLFLATAIARWLDEHPAARLDDPVGPLLGDLAGDRTLTWRMLVTHTAGFDTIDCGLIVRPGDQADPSQPPFRPGFAAPAGGLPAYSNYGSALAARALEQVRGAPIDDILRRDVFEPLGMTSARLLSVDEDGIRLARRSGQGKFTPLHPFYAAVGGAACSMEDALRFARFLLAAANGDRTPLLSPEAAALLTTPLAGPDDGTLGVGMFVTSVRSPGLHLVGHTGSWVDYAAVLAALPERDVAVFGAMLQPETAGLSPDAAWGALISAFSESAARGTAPAGCYVSSKRLSGLDFPVH
ncbi:serine hydrolase domain-containing protein, partial [Aphanothece microscopica]|uniref:serine hydrolase domain-containing protein n=1 Tax=Aphanothece microscopica TaxID=1049561 RepID=UPI00398489EF